ncbi:MAG: hypothetical protein GY810_19945 [Aureispira sp.]|nr:hypothetical protein [Aureispira sp.]
MFGRVKKWFGIEGAKLRLHVLESYPKDVKTLNGEIEVTSMRPQQVIGLKMRLIEVYTRGRGENKRIDEYHMGTWEYVEPFAVDKDQGQKILFKMDFDFVKSAMDTRSSKSFLHRGVVGLAKSFKGVSSEYILEAEAQLDDTKWTAYTKTKIHFA